MTRQIDDFIYSCATKGGHLIDITDKPLNKAIPDCLLLMVQKAPSHVYEGFLNRSHNGFFEYFGFNPPYSGLAFDYMNKAILNPKGYEGQLKTIKRFEYDIYEHLASAIYLYLLWNFKHWDSEQWQSLLTCLTLYYLEEKGVNTCFSDSDYSFVYSIKVPGKTYPTWNELKTVIDKHFKLDKAA